jgi:predicted nucleic acid-binding Zn ribbon protein
MMWQIYVKRNRQWTLMGSPFAERQHAEQEVSRMKAEIKAGREKSFSEPHCVPV